MAKANLEWTILPHGPIEKLSPRVWRVEGTLAGMPLKRVMTIVRCASGRLLVHNAIAIDESSMAEIAAWGEVGWILVPNGYHRLDAPAFAKRFPTAQVLCPPGARKKVQEVVTVHGTYADFPKDASVSLHLLDGVADEEGYVQVSDEAGVTLVMNDLVFNMPHLPGAQGFVLKHLTRSTGGPQLTRVSRFFLVKDKAKVRAQLERLAGIEHLTRVIVSHHQTIETTSERSVSDVLRSVAATV